MPVYPPGSWLDPNARPEGSAVGAAGRFAFRPGQRVDRHHHDGEELWLIASGEGTVLVDGAERRVSAGDIVLHPAGAAHDIVSVAVDERGEGVLSGFFVEHAHPGERTGHLHDPASDADGHEIAADAGSGDAR